MQTAFTETTRTVETPEVTVTKIPGYEAYLIQPNNSSICYCYIDYVLQEWWGEISEIVAEIEEEDMVTQYYAWREPERWIPDTMMSAIGLEEALKSIHMETPLKFHSNLWATTHSEFDTPTKIIKAMMVSHDGRYNYNTHSLLQALHEAGKLDEGEIK